MDKTPRGLRSKLRRAQMTLGVAGLCIGLAACSAPPASHPQDEPWDPYESTNRAVHGFNKGVDRALLRPVAKTYSGIMGDEVEMAIANFSDNLSLPRAVINNILQGNMQGATTDTYRFLMNSTFGLLGIYDTATELNFPEATDADFGETLAVWGVREGAYQELPLLGPSTERATVGKIVDFFLDPLDYAWLDDADDAAVVVTSADVSKVLSRRGQLAGFIDPVLDDSPDSYAELRSLYIQNRRLELGGTESDAYLDPYDDPNVIDLE